jgi:metal-responsive CopG/Arc/MetJ family transcriptional regulator
MNRDKVRTTFALPSDLLEAVDAVVQAGQTASRSEFLALALRNQLAAYRRSAIDAAFAEMASDSAYQGESQETAELFAATDWEAFQFADGGS